MWLLCPGKLSGEDAKTSPGQMRQPPRVDLEKGHRLGLSRGGLRQPAHCGLRRVDGGADSKLLAEFFLCDFRLCLSFETESLMMMMMKKET